MRVQISPMAPNEAVVILLTALYNYTQSASETVVTNVMLGLHSFLVTNKVDVPDD